ncbi:HAMP domain-containing sensor histidine kinase [Croceicoccus bisphenolivorans]|uniref:HAMP domain-containing sensor histidine kinase n=1 Tax=Croceicoccus bisphenolivorans TaxID=1783232 RepID=UPI0008366CBC|nr:HAMP domain-containing sensor histidine kinase [Croceicoccus bisphenolivorans]
MKSRLFWKILLAFGLTFFVMIQVIGLIFQMRRDAEMGPEFDFAPPFVVAGAIILEDSGRAAFERYKDDLPDRVSQSIHLRHTSSTPVENRVANFEKTVRTPDGEAYTIAWVMSAPKRPGGVFNVPPDLLIVGLFGGLVFSAALAFYLAIPIGRLRVGFDRLAAGYLDTRVSAQMGRRNDEIADLGRDFDLMAKRLEDLMGARVRLLHDVSHEFRSPLARMQLATSLVDQSKDNIEVSLQRINLEIDRLNELTEELLTLTRVETDGVAPDQDYFDLCEVVRSVIDDGRFESVAAPDRISLRIDGLPGEGRRPLVQGNARLIRRAIENVLRNALIYSPDKAAIRVALSYSEKRRYYTLDIEDDGPGIDPEFLPMIFDPFVKSRKGSSGFGLGLAIARRAIQAHGGTIEACNGKPTGFCVTVQLPASDQMPS